LIGFTEIKYFEDLQINTLHGSYCDITTCGAYSVLSVIINLLRKKLYLSDLKTQFIPRSKHSGSVIKTDKLMMYREIMAVCSEV
jgi:hypothetical protein